MIHFHILHSSSAKHQKISLTFRILNYCIPSFKNNADKIDFAFHGVLYYILTQFEESSFDMQMWRYLGQHIIASLITLWYA